MSKTTWQRRLGVTALALAASAAWAQQESTVADRLSAMEAQIQILQKQGQLNQARVNAAGSQVTSLPKVLAIAGFEGDLSARLILANGTIANVKEGEVLRSDMSVAAITPKAVIVKLGSGKKTTSMPLEFVAGSTISGGGGPIVTGAPMPVPMELLPPLPRVNVAPAARTQAQAPTTSARADVVKAPAAPNAPAPAAAPAAPSAPQAGPAAGLPIAPAPTKP